MGPNAAMTTAGRMEKITNLKVFPRDRFKNVTRKPVVTDAQKNLCKVFKQLKNNPRQSRPVAPILRFQTVLKSKTSGS
jgi:hypothetical protein